MLPSTPPPWSGCSPASWCAAPSDHGRERHMAEKALPTPIVAAAPTTFHHLSAPGKASRHPLVCLPARGAGGARLPHRHRGSAGTARRELGGPLPAVGGRRRRWGAGRLLLHGLENLPTQDAEHSAAARARRSSQICCNAPAVHCVALVSFCAMSVAACLCVHVLARVPVPSLLPAVHSCTLSLW